MKIRIVSYEDVNGWILGKFAKKLEVELKKKGLDVEIGNTPDANADVNHHIIYLGYDVAKSSGINTLMITHVDDIMKLNMISRQLKVADAGICMSRETMQTLVNYGIDSSRLAFINPAHDQVMVPRKIKIGITSKVHPDGCKREHLLTELTDHIDPKIFEFVIMGNGWQRIITRMEKKGFACEYIEDFDYSKYVILIPKLDFYLYLGKDEGSMGWIDALAAGVKTIVTTQGYHLDAPHGITHPFDSIDDLKLVFRNIAFEKRSLLEAVSTWTWEDYAIKHLELWSYLLGNRTFEIPSKYLDGVNSLHHEKIKEDFDLVKYKISLTKGTLIRNYNRIKSIRNFKTLKIKLKNFMQRKFKKQR